MDNTNNIEDIMEEFEEMFAFKRHEGITVEWFLGKEQLEDLKHWLRNALQTAKAQGREEERGRVVQEVLQIIHDTDPNSHIDRSTSPAYWGNQLREKIQALKEE